MEEIKLEFNPEERQKEVAEQIGKHLAWELLDAYKEVKNLRAYTRAVIRKQDDCSLLRREPSKDLRVKYAIPYDGGFTSVIWWLLEQWEKGNITIKEDELRPK